MLGHFCRIRFLDSEYAILRQILSTAELANMLFHRRFFEDDGNGVQGNRARMDGARETVR
jgi:hypothetical protein